MPLLYFFILGIYNEKIHQVKILKYGDQKIGHIYVILNFYHLVGLFQLIKHGFEKMDLRR